MSKCAAFCVRGPRESTGRSLVQGSIASHRKTHLGGAAEPCTNFIQLEVRNVQVAEGVLMEELSVLACPSEPRGDSGLTVAEDSFGGGRIQSFGQPRRAPWRPAAKGFSDGTGECGVEH